MSTNRDPNRGSQPAVPPVPLSPPAPLLVPFVPADERQISDVLSCLGDPDLTLSDVASRHNTTLHALVLWLAQDEIATRVQAIERAFALKTRLQVADALPGIACTLVEIVRDTQNELSHVPLNHASTRHLEQRTRCRETGRKACTLLLRLARFQGGPAPERRPRLLEEPSARPAPPRREEISPEALMAGLTRLGIVLPRQAGDEAPPQPPLSCSSPSTPNPRVSLSPIPPPLNDTPRAPAPSSASHLINNAGAAPTPCAKHKPVDVVLTISAKSKPAADKKAGPASNKPAPRRDGPSARPRTPEPRRKPDLTAHPRAPT